MIEPYAKEKDEEEFVYLKEKSDNEVEETTEEASKNE